MNRKIAPSEVTYEDFALYFPKTPTALCIKECARLFALRKFRLTGPILDAGCGDGLFAGIAYAGQKVWGIDINPHEAKLAKDSGAYETVIVGDLTHDLLPSDYFHTCVANCSLEHIPRIDLALQQIYRSLAPGGLFLTFVPNPSWARHLYSYRAAKLALGEHSAERLRGAIDTFFAHHHLYDADGWANLAKQAGFSVKQVDPVLSTQTTVGFEAFLLPAFFSWLNKRVTHRWTHFTTARTLFTRPTYSLVRSAMQLGDKELTAEYLLVARKGEGEH